jgi:hypothetical protein
MGHFSGRLVFVHVALAFLIIAFTTTRANAQSFTVAPALSSAQQNPQPRNPSESLTLGWGIKSGVQWPSSDDVSNGLDHIGGALGVFIDFNQHGKIGVDGDILFVNDPQSDEPGAPVGSLHLLEIPLLVRLRQQIVPSNRVAVFAVAGPAFNLKISGDDEFPSQSVDFAFGGGLEINDILIEARFKRGSRDKVIVGVTSSFTQQTFAILLGFRLRP